VRGYILSQIVGFRKLEGAAVDAAAFEGLVEEFGDGSEGVAGLFEGRDEAFDRDDSGGVDVVEEDDTAGFDVLDGDVIDGLDVFALPVAGVNRPEY